MLEPLWLSNPGGNFPLCDPNPDSKADLPELNGDLFAVSVVLFTQGGSGQLTHALPIEDRVFFR